MKKILSILLVLSFSLALTAQNSYKILESSSKKAPKWIYGVEKDYLNVSATGESIEEACAVHGVDAQELVDKLNKLVK